MDCPGDAPEERDTAMHMGVNQPREYRAVRRVDNARGLVARREDIEAPVSIIVFPAIATAPSSI
jgi:hypothetical protein